VDGVGGGASERGESVPPSQGAYPHKVSFYQAPEDTARMRGAILHTQSTEGPRSLSKFIDDAVMEKVVHLEERYNGGEPFPAVEARSLPQGRPATERSGASSKQRLAAP
jgi:Centromere-binding protein ParB C-terminal